MRRMPSSYSVPSNLHALQHACQASPPGAQASAEPEGVMRARARSEWTAHDGQFFAEAARRNSVEQDASGVSMVMAAHSRNSGLLHSLEAASSGSMPKNFLVQRMLGEKQKRWEGAPGGEWTVHDGKFFASSIRNQMARAPNEFRYLHDPSMQEPVRAAVWERMTQQMQLQKRSSPPKQAKGKTRPTTPKGNAAANNGDGVATNGDGVATNEDLECVTGLIALRTNKVVKTSHG